MIQARLAILPFRLLPPIALIAMALVASSALQAATMRFDGGGGDDLWETAANWDALGSPDTLPAAADIADISDSYSVTVSSVQPLTELQVAHPDSSPATTPGTATLNIANGTDIKVSNNNGIRIGRKVQAGQLAGSSKGVVIQTGGLLQQTAGGNGLRLSQADSGTVADSLYRISGGSVRGGPTNGAMTAPLQLGAIANTFTSAEFHMVGSSVTEARFEDIRMQGSPTGNAKLHFSLDAGGVTPIIAEDELRFTYHTPVSGLSNNSLEIDLIGLAPLTDITLIMADRLSLQSGLPSPVPPEIFTGMPEGTAISASFGPPSQQYTYNWTIDYQDGSDNGVLDAYVKLVFVSRTLSVPEPASFLLYGLGGVALAMVRRRGR